MTLLLPLLEITCKAVFLVIMTAAHYHCCHCYRYWFCVATLLDVLVFRLSGRSALLHRRDMSRSPKAKLLGFGGLGFRNQDLKFGV